ncbi:Mov34/MPN/PAD-1 family protein [Parafrankia sp. BMG5.11]|uniref:Mov34/MPN/PAD-1 family protein n=1 Tax=Parafrankia sp. BMG5.11 TaxID=222540 RepID=UPI0010386D57|nr:M67 family metallopeptidase [Parafrankia sp. BMG5.11]TCJ40950.1 M67 family peptidase [Parafrankia sp. BMG5.11]
MGIEVSSGVVERLIAEAADAYPLEACGLLLGNKRVEEVRPCANVHPDPARHFAIDPQALIDAHREARGGGPQVIGYYHSHPLGPPAPSATDRAHATGDGRVWAIVGEGRVGWWRDAATGFEPLSYRQAGG